MDIEEERELEAEQAKIQKTMVRFFFILLIILIFCNSEHVVLQSAHFRIIKYLSTLYNKCLLMEKI